jgi:ABC-type antimicrobial peptide transport system permease subunit
MEVVMSTRFAPLGIAVAFAISSMFAPSASATVTFDPEAGTGFVGKGDVQDLFGWNNEALQGNASSVSFFVTQDGEGTIECSQTIVEEQEKEKDNNKDGEKDNDNNKDGEKEKDNNKDGEKDKENDKEDPAVSTVTDTFPVDVEVTTIVSDVERQNKQGKNTGFNLMGYGAKTTTSGSCPAGWDLVADSLVVGDLEDPILHVKFGTQTFILP